MIEPRLTVLCVMRTGGDYDARYVRALRRGVRKYLPIPHQFLCLTDDPELLAESYSILLNHGWSGWWSKMELFRFPGPCLYFDLDTLIRAPLTRLAEEVVEGRRMGMGMLRAFRPHEKWASGILAWDGDWRWLYESFLASPMRWMIQFRGDQDYIKHALRREHIEPWAIQDALEHSVLSYKWHCQPGEAPAPSIVCFHGKPRPHVAARQSAWVREEWDDGRGASQVASPVLASVALEEGAA